MRKEPDIALNSADKPIKENQNAGSTLTRMPKSPYELAIEKLTDELVKNGKIDEASRLLAIVQVQSAEAQREAANAAKHNGRYMLWAVVATTVSAIITAVILVFTTLNSSTPQLFGKEPARLILLYKDASGKLVDLDGREIHVETFQDTERKKWKVRFYCVLKNIGDEPASKPVLKYYTNYPSLSSESPSADEPQYQYEETVPFGEFIANMVPGEYATSIEVSLGIFDNDQFVLSNEPVLMKVYYSNGNIARATLFLTKKRTNQD